MKSFLRALVNVTQMNANYWLSGMRMEHTENYYICPSVILTEPLIPCLKALAALFVRYDCIACECEVDSVDHMN